MKWSRMTDKNGDTLEKRMQMKLEKKIWRFYFKWKKIFQQLVL